MTTLQVKIKPKQWMMFRTSSFVYYIWNGEFPVLLSVPKDSNANAYYWTGVPPNNTDVLPKEIDALNEVCDSKKRVFKLASRKGITYTVVQRGEFIEE